MTEKPVTVVPRKREPENGVQMNQYAPPVNLTGKLVQIVGLKDSYLLSQGANTILLIVVIFNVY